MNKISIIEREAHEMPDLILLTLYRDCIKAICEIRVERNKVRASLDGAIASSDRIRMNELARKNNSLLDDYRRFHSLMLILRKEKFLRKLK
jgi:hypothetical protein